MCANATIDYVAAYFPHKVLKKIKDRSTLPQNFEEND